MNSNQQSLRSSKILNSFERNITRLMDPQTVPTMIHSFEQSHPNPLNIFQLESSIRNTSKKSESVADRIDKMEEFYVDRIRQLELRISHLEGEKETLQEQISRLGSLLEKEREQRYRMQDKESEQKQLAILQEFRAELQTRMNGEKQLRMQLQLDNLRLQQENSHIKEAYKQAVQNYRRLLRSDLNRIQRETTTQDNSKQLRVQIKSLKSKTKRVKEGQKILTKDLIPEVQKEIRNIKKKLNSM